MNPKIAAGRGSLGSLVRSHPLLACWVVACLFCLILYWPGLTAWFQRDDFDWLGLEAQVRAEGSLLNALFAPKAQGTVRFLGERAYFLGLSWVFGLNSLPFRLCAFLTAFASLALLIAIVHRLTRSVLAAGLAPLLWLVNSALAPVMTWSALYNQILGAFFFLLGLWQLERFLETGKTRYCAGQWLAFLAGFGTTEITVAYPALAAAYCLCRRRRIPRSVLALFLGSLAFLVIEFTLIHPHARTGLYALHFDGSVIRTFLRHWQNATGPGRLFALGLLGRRTGMWLSVAVSAGLLLHLWRTARTGDRSAAFWLAWFVLALAPVLPLRDRIVDYYPAIPGIGLAVLAAAAVHRARRDASRLLRVATAAWVGIYVVSSLVAARELTTGYHEDSVVARCFIQELRRIHGREPGSPIVVQSFAPRLHAAVIPDRSWRLFGIPDVRILPPAACSRIHREEYVAVYDFDGRSLVDVTADYRIPDARAGDAAASQGR
ncbi:MAG: hypothetical protein ABSH05_09980 [Bryobacteraceae bacterium]